MSRFGLTFDYLCPFARNANEHVVGALRAGADWDVEFLPFSLAQNHVEEGEPALWAREDPNAAGGILALQVGLAARDTDPDRFLDVHVQLFAARHDRGEDLKDRNVVRAALERAGADADAIMDLVDDGGPLEVLRKEHERVVRDHEVWGVPTFIGTDRAVFVRLLSRPEGDGQLATRTIERVFDLLDGFAELHEFKQSDLPV